MAHTTYPKSYIIERIEARLTSIRSFRQRYEERVTEYNAELRERLLSWYGGVVKYQQQAAANAKKALAILEKSTPATLSESVKKAHKAGGGMNRYGSHGSYGSYENPMPELSDAKFTLDGNDAAQAASKVGSERREEASLEHALAYLRETPVDEFSLTGLKTLGLLDVIKFRLVERA